MRNEIDGAIYLSDDLLTKVVQCYLRYLDIDFPIGKTSTDEVYVREMLEPKAVYA